MTVSHAFHELSDLYYMEWLAQMHDFERTHSKESVYELKKASSQELKELPLTERSQQRLSQIESKNDKNMKALPIVLLL